MCSPPFILTAPRETYQRLRCSRRSARALVAACVARRDRGLRLHRDYVGASAALFVYSAQLIDSRSRLIVIMHDHHDQVLIMLVPCTCCNLHLRRFAARASVSGQLRAALNQATLTPRPSMQDSGACMPHALQALAMRAALVHCHVVPCTSRSMVTVSFRVRVRVI